MPSTINVDRSRKGQFFLNMSSIFQQILITFGIEVDEHLLYHQHQSKYKSDTIKSAFLIEMTLILYLAHPHEGHLFQCVVLIFKLIAIKFGLYLLMRLLYRPHKLEFKSDAVESVFLIKTVMILYLAHPQEAHLFQCSVLIFHLMSMKIGL